MFRQLRESSLSPREKLNVSAKFVSTRLAVPFFSRYRLKREVMHCPWPQHAGHRVSGQVTSANNCDYLSNAAVTGSGNFGSAPGKQILKIATLAHGGGVAKFGCKQPCLGYFSQKVHFEESQG